LRINEPVSLRIVDPGGRSECLHAERYIADMALCDLRLRWLLRHHFPLQAKAEVEARIAAVVAMIMRFMSVSFSK
jgi:hypothetical protein